MDPSRRKKKHSAYVQRDPLLPLLKLFFPNGVRVRTPICLRKKLCLSTGEGGAGERARGDPKSTELLSMCRMPFSFLLFSSPPPPQCFEGKDFIGTNSLRDPCCGVGAVRNCSVQTKLLTEGQAGKIPALHAKSS